MASRLMTRIFGTGVPAAGFGCAAAGVTNTEAAKAKAPAATTPRVKIDCIFMALESCPSTEVDDFRPVIFCFGDRYTEVDLDRTEGRFPADANSGGSA